MPVIKTIKTSTGVMPPMEIDWTSPLVNTPTGRLVLAAVALPDGRFYDCITKQYTNPLPPGRVTLQRSIEGLGSTAVFLKNVASGTTLTFPKPTLMDSVNGAYSIFFEGTWNTSGTSSQIVYSQNSSNGYGFGIRFDDGSSMYGGVQNQVWNSSGQTNNPSGSFANYAMGSNGAGLMHRAALTYDLANARLYTRRKLWGTGAMTAVPAADSNRRTTIASNIYGGNATTLSMILVWSGVISLNQYQELYDNPRKLFTKKATKTFFAIPKPPGGDMLPVIATTAIASPTVSLNVSTTGFAATGTIGSITASPPGYGALTGVTASGVVGSILGVSTVVSLIPASGVGNTAFASPSITVSAYSNSAYTTGVNILSFGSAGVYTGTADPVASASTGTTPVPKPFADSMYGLNTWSITAAYPLSGSDYRDAVPGATGTVTITHPSGYTLTTGTVAGNSGFAQPNYALQECVFTGSVSGNVLTVTAITQGALLRGWPTPKLVSASNVYIPDGVYLASTGGTGGSSTGTYTLTQSLGTIPSGPMKIVYGPGQYWIPTGKGMLGDACIFSDAIASTGRSSVTRLARTDNAPFDLVSIDLTCGINGGNTTGTNYTLFTGYQNGTQVVQQVILQTLTQYTLNGDGTRRYIPKFETFTLNGFTNLNYVVWEDYGWASGNLNGGSASNGPYVNWNYINTRLSPTNLVPTISAALVGNSSTSNLGTVVGPVTPTQLLTGVYGSGQTGSLPGVSTLTSISGVYGNASIGAISSVITVVNLTGVSANGGVGTVPSILSAPAVLGGVSGTGQAGTTLAAIYPAALSGVSAQGNVGSVTAPSTGGSAITGASGTSGLGSIVSIGILTSLIGVFGTGAIGSVGSTLRTGPLLGVYATGTIGTTSGQVTTMRIVGPIGARSGSTSNFTLQVDGVVGTSITVIPNDNGAGGTFSPSSIVVSNGTPSVSTTYTSPSGIEQNITLSLVTDDGTVRAPNVNYAALNISGTSSIPFRKMFE